MRKVHISVLLSALILAVQGYAQNITGSISGRVVDPSGAAIPDATVQANDSVRNTTVKTITTPQGEFSLAGLQPGTYMISITAAGFKKLDDPNIAVDAQDHLALGNLILQIGAVSESIEVSADSALLQTESAERSQAI